VNESDGVLLIGTTGVEPIAALLQRCGDGGRAVRRVEGKAVACGVVELDVEIEPATEQGKQRCGVDDGVDARGSDCGCSGAGHP
jgi:hypothetical protein